MGNCCSQCIWLHPYIIYRNIIFVALWILCAQFITTTLTSNWFKNPWGRVSRNIWTWWHVICSAWRNYGTEVKPSDSMHFSPHVAKPHSYCQCPISLVRWFKRMCALFIIFLLKSMKFIPPNKSSKELILRAIDMFSWYSLKQQRKTVLLKRRIELKFYDNSEYFRFTSSIELKITLTHE